MDPYIYGVRKKIHIIDQEKCDACGICFEVCPTRFDAVRKTSGEPVPPPLPDEQRAVISKSTQQ